MVSRFWAKIAPYSPRVMPGTRCNSKSRKWWPGTESNHRHTLAISGASNRATNKNHAEAGICDVNLLCDVTPCVVGKAAGARGYAQAVRASASLSLRQLHVELDRGELLRRQAKLALER